MSKEAMKLALEYRPTMTAEVLHSWAAEMKKTAQEALAEQPAQQEPVVWMYQNKSTHQVSFQKHMRAFVDHGVTYETPLYTTPPAQRTWVGLTDEEYSSLHDGLYQQGKSLGWVVDQIEDKLREKNT